MNKVEFSSILPLDDFRNSVVVRTLVATPEECEKLAKRFGILTLQSLKAKLTVFRESGLIVVEGELEASIVQECIRTLEPLSSIIKAPFRLTYITKAKSKHALNDDLSDLDGPEVLEEDYLDLGEIVAQSLALEIDPYPVREEDPV